MLIESIKTRIFHENEDLPDFIFEHVKNLPERSVLAITSKIVALSQDRVIKGGAREKEKWIKKESKKTIKTQWCFLTLKDGAWCANAGIDESNVQKSDLVLLPRNPMKTARELRKEIMTRYRINDFGIIITDSRTVPLRAGVLGVTIGCAGFRPIKNYVGKKDLFGRKLKLTKTNVSDSLAAVAVLVMGEAAERCPITLIKNIPRIKFTNDAINLKNLLIAPKEDIYRYVFKK